jgi:hypothetical protein
MSSATRCLVMDPDAAGRHCGGVAPDARRLHQPKASLCRMLAVLWIFPTVGAAFILGASEAKWRQADGILDGLRAVSFEQWIAFVILVAHLVFAWLAWRFRRTEPWREIAPQPDPDADLRETP